MKGLTDLNSFRLRTRGESKGQQRGIHQESNPQKINPKGKLQVSLYLMGDLDWLV